MERALRLVGVSLATTLVVAAATAQEGDQPQATFFAPVEVPLVSVDVFVSGRDGHPIQGLTLEDFEVLEDGEPVEISHFFAAPGLAVTTDEEDETPDIGLVSPGPSQDVYLVIYFDDTNLTRGRRQAVVEHLREFLSTGLPADMKVMLVRYDGQIHIEQAFSENRDEVTTALDTVQNAASVSRRIDETTLIREMETSVSLAALSGDSAMEILESSGRTIRQGIDFFVEQTVQRTRTSIAHQRRLIRSLSGLSGRKAIFFVSDGVEARPGELLYQTWSQHFGAVPAFRIEAQQAFLLAARNDFGTDYGKLSRFANGHRVSIYTVSAVGSGQARALSAETRLIDEARLAVSQGMSAEVLMSNMAGMTGGRPLVNSPALADQLVEVSEELASYYSLAFEPPHVGDGKYHRLEVRVKRDSVRIRHRDGYLDVPLTDRITDRTLAAAAYGVVENPLRISVSIVGEIIDRNDGTYLVPVIIMIPIGELVMVPSEEEHEGRISILLTVCGQDGNLSDPTRREYPVAIPNDSLTMALSRTAGFTMRLAVRSGRQRIAVGVRDEIALTESVTILEVEVGEAGGLDG